MNHWFPLRPAIEASFLEGGTLRGGRLTCHDICVDFFCFQKMSELPECFYIYIFFGVFNNDLPVKGFWEADACWTSDGSPVVSHFILAGFNQPADSIHFISLRQLLSSFCEKFYSMCLGGENSPFYRIAFHDAKTNDRNLRNWPPNPSFHPIISLISKSE